jgi:ABC-type nitrate/sulfonate/bicarbonate transport system substrate-binding protein
MFKSSCVAGVLLAASFAWSGVSQAAEKVVLTIPTSTLSLSSFFIAKDSGLFAKEGIEMEDRLIVGVGAVNAVLAGSADFAISAGSSMTRAVAQGQKLIALGVLVDKPMVELVIRKDVAEAAGITRDMPLAERAKRLKGKTIAIQGVGSAVHASERLIVAQGGLDVENDVRITPMDPPAMVPAMMAKQVDGFATSLPFTTQPIVDGTAIALASLPMGDLPQYNPIAYLVLMTRPEVCQQNRQKCIGVVKALNAANKFMKEKTDEAAKILRPRYKEMDQKVFDAAWPVVVAAHPATMALTEQALANAQRFGVDAKLEDPKDSVKDLKGLFTNEYLN